MYVACLRHCVTLIRMLCRLQLTANGFSVNAKNALTLSAAKGVKKVKGSIAVGSCTVLHLAPPRYPRRCICEEQTPGMSFVLSSG